MSARARLSPVRWETYRELVAANDQGGLRLAFDRGCLEMERSLLPQHEVPKKRLAVLVETLAETWNVELIPLGSTTFSREALQRGAEPDESYLIGDTAVSVIDPEAIDPETIAPDLVIEVDLSSPSIDKLPLYAALGVREVWRYRPERVEILTLAGDGYRAASQSALLAPLRVDSLNRLLAEGRKERLLAWRRRVRRWAEENTA